jgi:hypothetical protein
MNMRKEQMDSFFLAAAPGEKCSFIPGVAIQGVVGDYVF